MLPLLEESYLKEYREGYREGFKEGFKEGQILNAHRFILCLLRYRFHNIPNFIKERIESIRDEFVLESLHIEASECSSMEEFEQRL